MLPLEKKSLGKYILSLLVTFSLPSQSVLPIYSSPLSCLLITSFLFLPSHSVLPISSSTLSCLLILSLYNPSCFLITSFLSPETHYFVSSFTTFCPLLHLFLLLVSSFFFSCLHIPLSCIHFRCSYFFIHFFQTLFPFPIF